MIRAVRIILIVGAALAAVLAVFLGIFCYDLDYRVSEIARKAAPDGSQEVVFYEIGSAVFFGPSDVRLVLEQDGTELNRIDLSISNDGKSLDDSNWSPVWLTDQFRVFIYGEEQTPQYCDLPKNGPVACHPVH